MARHLFVPLLVGYTIFISSNAMATILMPEGCHHEGGMNSSIFCYCNNSMVGDIINVLSTNIKRLTFSMKNQHIQYPVNTTVDLQNLTRFSDLEYFKLGGNSRKQLYPYHIKFHENTFRNLTTLTELHINVATTSLQLDKIKSHIPLQVVNLSGTKLLQFEQVKAIVNGLVNPLLKKLSLSNFQMIGTQGYSVELNISTFFSQVIRQRIEVDLSGNALGVIYPSIITMLPNLIKLDISNNYLLAITNDPLLMEVILHPTMEEFYMDNQVDVAGDVNENRDVSIVNGQHPSTNVSQYDTEKDLFVRVLKIMMDCVNTYSNGNISAMLNNNTMFCLSIRCTSQLSPTLLKGVPCEAYGNAKDILDFSCTYFIRLPFLPNMRNLSLNNLHWFMRSAFGIGKQICIRSSPLEYFSAAHNTELIKSFGVLDTLNKTCFTDIFRDIKQVNLSYNGVNFLLEGVFNDLKVIDLSGNSFSFRNKSLCSAWPNLRKLYIQFNQISHVFDGWLTNCTQLEVLDICNNLINFNNNSLNIRTSKLLQIIDLNNNGINWLPTQFTRQVDDILSFQNSVNHQTKLTLIFEKNPLQCQCTDDSIEFIIWFQLTKAISTKENYSCSSSSGKIWIQDVDVNHFKNNCLQSNTQTILKSVASTVGLMIFVLILFSIHRYRWRLQYGWYKLPCKMCVRRTEIQSTEDDNVKVIYDAFVSYCAEDRFWVHDCLMKTMESGQYGLKLCIHYRDFLPGEDISSAIVTSIIQSRKLLIVVSEVSLTKPWCQFELQVALSEAVKRGAKLTIIKLGSIQTIEDRTVAWLMDNHTYLEWSEDKDAQKVFWIKLLGYMFDDAGRCSFFACLCDKISRKGINATASINDEYQALLD